MRRKKSRRKDLQTTTTRFRPNLSLGFYLCSTTVVLELSTTELLTRIAGPLRTQQLHAVPALGMRPTLTKNATIKSHAHAIKVCYDSLCLRDSELFFLLTSTFSQLCPSHTHHSLLKGLLLASSYRSFTGTADHDRHTTTLMKDNLSLSLRVQILDPGI